MSEAENTFSNYGLYDVDDSLEISLPDTEIKFDKISSDVFSYYRKNSDGKIIEKMIPVESNTLKIEVAPIRPLNHPARRTSAMYLLPSMAASCPHMPAGMPPRQTEKSRCSVCSFSLSCKMEKHLTSSILP